MVASADGSFSTSHHLDSPEFSFPFRLFLLLKHAEEQGMDDIISWTEDGKGFKVHDPRKFESMFLAENFKMKKYASFTRQLCAYGFSCIRKGRQPGIYFHPDFSRDNADTSSKISRGAGKKYASLCKKSQLSNAAPQTLPIPTPLLAQDGMTCTSSTPTNPLMFMNQADNRSNSHGTAEVVQSTNLSSMPGQGSSEANMNVLSNLYSHVRQAIKWQNEPAQRGVQGGAMGRISPDSHVIPCDRSSINSPVSIDPFDSGPSMSYGNHQSNGASQPTFDHLIESACDIMVRHDATDDQMAPSENRVAYDDFDPIPLSKIEGIHPSSMSVLDQSITSSSAEDDLFLFEPRSIEDMVERPSNAPTMFNNIPSLSPRQQAWAEYSLPLFLPLIFYVGKLSKLGILWCSVIIVGHTLQTLFTAFEPAAADLRYKPSIGMIQHHFIDCIWVQSLVSAMLLTPQNFGANSVYTGVFLIPLVPIYLAVSLKTHFEQKVLENATYATTARSIKRRQKLVQQVGETLRDTVAWYLASIAVVLLGHHTFSFNLIVLGVFVLNAAPISTLASYTYQFKKSSDLLIRKQKML